MAEKLRIERFGIFPRVHRTVFGISAGLMVAFIAIGVIFTGAAGRFFALAQTAVTVYFGWLLTLTSNILLSVCVYLAIGRYGDIRLGRQTEKPEYSTAAWTSMLFSAGVGIGLLYWAVAEPLFHFFSPPLGAPETEEAAAQVIVLSFLHWGFHAWAFYGVVGLSLGYFHFRRGLLLSIRSGFYPLIGDRIYGPIGHTADILAVFGTMFGIVTSLGLGVMQVNAGLTYLFDVPDSVAVQLVLIAGITALATVSVYLGLDRGIKRVSAINIWLSFALFAFIVITGPTLFIFDSFVENIGNYLTGLIDISFWNEAYSGTSWQNDWTLFYWAWWISWSPFVGIFIARISRGRTIREFVSGILLIPTTILFFWFTAFGGTAIRMELDGDPGLIEATRENYGSAIFQLLEHFPFTGPLTATVIVMIVIWFVTSSDSGSFVIDMLTAGGDPNPPKVQRIFWATTEGAIAAILLVAGGLSALQAAAVVAGFPFTSVILIMAYALLRALGRDTLMLYRHDQAWRTDAEAEANAPREIAGEKTDA